MDSRLIGLSFCQLEGNELRLATDKIMMRCAAICGCPLPLTEDFAKIISDEITVFINNFGYGNLTLNEIIFALRLNANGNIKLPSGAELEFVEFTGHRVNVSFISKVLKNYMVLRNLLDRKIQNKIDGYE